MPTRSTENKAEKIQNKKLKTLPFSLSDLLNNKIKIVDKNAYDNHF